jgi:hypothetical protein
MTPVTWGSIGAYDYCTPAVLTAKLEVVPVRRGYWGKKIGLPYTVPNKIHGKCGSGTISSAALDTNAIPSRFQGTTGRVFDGKGVGRHHLEGAICRGSKAFSPGKVGLWACGRWAAKYPRKQQCACKAIVVVILLETWQGGSRQRRQQQQATEQKLGEDGGIHNSNCERFIALHSRIEAQAQLSCCGECRPRIVLASAHDTNFYLREGGHLYHGPFAPRRMTGMVCIPMAQAQCRRLE